MVYIKLIFPLLFFFSYVNPLTNNISATVALSRRGIGFFSSIGHKIVTRELPKIEFPNITLPINGGPGIGTVNVSGLKIPKFESPLFKFDLSPPDSITWKSEGGAVKILGNWSAVYDWITSIYLGGWVEVLVTGVDSFTSLSVYSELGHPQLHMHRCMVDVERLHMTLGGGVIEWIVNLFSADLSSAIKQAIHNQLCETTKTTLVDEANNALKSLPKHLNIVGNIYIDYNVEENPVEVHLDHVIGQSNIDVMLLNMTCLLPQEPVILSPVDDSYMINIWMSTQIGNCVLLSAHDIQTFRFTLTKDLYAKLGTFFQTSCQWYNVCAGKLLPTLAERYPQRHIELEFYTAARPILSVETTALIKSTFYIDIKIQAEEGKPKITDVLARLSMESVITVIPTLYNARLCGKVNGTDLQFYGDFSRIGNISDTFLHTLDMFLTPMLRVSADSLLRIGLPIPMIENMTLKDKSKIELKKNTIGIYADLEYLE